MGQRPMFIFSVFYQWRNQVEGVTELSVHKRQWKPTMETDEKRVSLILYIRSFFQCRQYHFVGTTGKRKLPLYFNFLLYGPAIYA
jgi:hypothetical protein